MRTPEHSEFKSVPSWENLSPQFRQAVLLSNALPEKFPKTNKKETRREDFGPDKEREACLDVVVSGLGGEEQDLFQGFLEAKRNYFVSLAKKYYPFIKFFRGQGMMGLNNRGWQAVVRHSLVMSEIAGNLGENLNNRGVEISPAAIRLAGLIHDIVKRREIEHLRNLQAQSQSTAESQKLTEEEIYKQMADFGGQEFAALVTGDEFKAELMKQIPDLKEAEFEGFIKAIRNIGEVGSVETVQEQGLDPEVMPLDTYKLLDNNISRVLFYLDQIIKHTAIVTVNERFSDARKRYASPESQMSAQFVQMDNREKIALRLERELAETLGIPAEGIQEYLSKIFFEKLYKTT